MGSSGFSLMLFQRWKCFHTRNVLFNGFLMDVIFVCGCSILFYFLLNFFGHRKGDNLYDFRAVFVYLALFFIVGFGIKVTGKTIQLGGHIILGMFLDYAMKLNIWKFKLLFFYLRYFDRLLPIQKHSGSMRFREYGMIPNIVNHKVKGS